MFKQLTEEKQIALTSVKMFQNHCDEFSWYRVDSNAFATITIEEIRANIEYVTCGV